jgi:beta-lactamase superfamily II metal-dependent hydrolase
MHSENLKPSLTILDVGHGSAAVLRDKDGAVVFDTGRGPDVLNFLRLCGIREVDAVYLSHQDADHIGGVESLLMATDIKVKYVFANSDPTKDTVAHQQLRYTIEEAEEKKGTITETSLTTSLNERQLRKGVRIEVLYPPPSVAISGVSGKDIMGNRLTSNSMSAVIRVGDSKDTSVLLGGDMEFACLDHWKKRNIAASAAVLVFPHHGGKPGDCNDGEESIFAHQLATLVRPKYVVFSNHRSLFGHPREDVLKALCLAQEDALFICTQLPDRIKPLVHTDNRWMFHRKNEGKGFEEGSIDIEFDKNGLKLNFVHAS